MIHKVADLKAGEYGRDVGVTPRVKRLLELSVIEKLVSEGKLPNGCWFVDVEVNVRFSVRGTADDVRDGNDWVSVAWSVPVEKQDVELKATEMKVEVVKSDVFGDLPPGEGGGG